LDLADVKGGLKGRLFNLFQTHNADVAKLKFKQKKFE